MDLHVPTRPVRFVTAASLFDGHDAAINVMRRILQSQGAEVVHLGHDRSVDAVVTAAVQEDVQGVALSSYQGGHVEYFTYLKERLAEVGAGHVQVFGGGGGVIVADEIALLAERGVRIFAPEDGQRLGLAGMINELIRSSTSPPPGPPSSRCSPETRRPSPGRSPSSRTAATPRWLRQCARRPSSGGLRCSASPARAGRARARSPTSSCGASGSTRRTSSASPCSPSTRPAAGAAARCSATASA
jgi:methylmalonyl-CoA mutase cobalamin-binding domain/chain